MDPFKRQLLDRIRSEYLEMPGLRLRRDQAKRLWGLEEGICAELLEQLIDEKFLCCKADGSYARLFDGRNLVVPRRQAKVSLGRKAVRQRTS
jgi:hypothetical protein